MFLPSSRLACCSNVASLSPKQDVARWKEGYASLGTSATYSLWRAKRCSCDKWQRFATNKPAILAFIVLVLVIGDLHGHWHEFMTALMLGGGPDDRTLIFCGDYVNRGEEDVEVHCCLNSRWPLRACVQLITCLFMLKVCYPSQVILLRYEIQSWCISFPTLFKRISGIQRHDTSVWLLRQVWGAVQGQACLWSVLCYFQCDIFFFILLFFFSFLRSIYAFRCPATCRHSQQRGVIFILSTSHLSSSSI